MKINNFQYVSPFLLILVHILFANCIVIVSKYAFQSFSIHPLIFLFLRNILSFLILLPIIFPTFKETFRNHRYHASFGRSASGIIAIAIWTYAYSHIPLTTATVLTFIIPIITLLLAIFVLKEKVSKGRIIVILTGLIGVVIALRPSFGSGNMYYILIFLATIFWAISNIARKVSTRNNIKNFLCYYSIWSLILTLLISMPFWSEASNLLQPKLILLLIITGGLTAIVNVMSFNSYKYNDVSLVQSFDFLRLIIVGIADIFLFGSTPNSYLFIGSFIIIISSIWLILHESKKLQKIANIQI